MIEMATIDSGVAASSAQFREEQTRFNRARDALSGALIIAFDRLAGCQQGDRIRVKVGMDRFIEGRAVVMTNGTRMGLFVEVRHRRNKNLTRHTVAEPYAEHVQVLPRQTRTARRAAERRARERQRRGY